MRSSRVRESAIREVDKILAKRYLRYNDRLINTEGAAKRSVLEGVLHVLNAIHYEVIDTLDEPPTDANQWAEREKNLKEEFQDDCS